MTNETYKGRNVLRPIRDNLIAEAEEIQKNFAGAHQQLYELLGKAVTIADILEEEPKKFATFKAHAKKQGLHVSKDPLRTVMCFVLKVTQSSGPAYERACCYTNAIAHLLEGLTVNADAVPGLIIERGGIEELYSEAKAVRAKEKQGLENAETPVNLIEPEDKEQADDDPPAHVLTNDTGLSGDGRKTPPSGNNVDSAEEPRKFSKAWCEERLVLELGPAKLQLALKMRDRQRGSLDFISSGRDDGGFKIFNVENFRLN